MRKIIILAFAAVIMFFWYPSNINAQVIPDEEGEEITITETPPPETGPKKSPSIIPITAYYYDSLSCIGLTFLFDIGEVTVTVSNLSTSEYYCYLVDSQNGSAIIPLSCTTGLWQLSISIDSGICYTGVFLIQ